MTTGSKDGKPRGRRILFLILSTVAAIGGALIAAGGLYPGFIGWYALAISSIAILHLFFVLFLGESFGCFALIITTITLVVVAISIPVILRAKGQPTPGAPAQH